MTATGAPSISLPDWSTQIEEICCPLCDYNLRGLTEPRCPECGYQFEWANLLDPTQRKHKYLFEHYPQRNIWSYTKTLLGSLNPFRFWKSLHPYQPSNPRRIFLYWSIALALTLLPFLTTAAPFLYSYSIMNQAARANQLAIYSGNSAAFAGITRAYGSFNRYLDLQYPLPTSARFYEQMWFGLGPWRLQALILPALLLWPWMTVGLLMIFQQSMNRAKILPAHVMRCVIYSDAIIYLGVLLTWPTLLLFGMRSLSFPPGMSIRAQLLTMRDQFMWQVSLIVPALWLFAIVRLIIAYQRYLRFPHASGVVISTQVILFLLLLTAFAVWLF